MRAARTGRAFTMIELLVVIGVIAILAAITLLVGRKMVDSGRAETTREVLRTLDTALQTYLSDRKVDGKLPLGVTVNGKTWPMSDARDMSNAVPQAVADAYQIKPGFQMINSVGLFIALVQSSDNEGAKAALAQLPSKFTGLYDIDGRAAGVSPSADPTQPELMTAFDAWRRPIRFVHPAFDGISKLTSDFQSSNPTATWGTQQIRRDYGMPRNLNTVTRAEELAEADAGQCEGTTGYFYSAGEDGYVGLNTEDGVDYDLDNVYTRKPRIPAARTMGRR